MEEEYKNERLDVDHVRHSKLYTSDTVTKPSDRHPQRNATESVRATRTEEYDIVAGTLHLFDQQGERFPFARHLMSSKI